jgi:bla regulator protein BlaR1
MMSSDIAPFANHVWQSTLFAAIVALLMLALRNNPARVRHTLWLCASLKFLVPFSVLITIGGSLGLPSRTPSAAAIVPANVPVLMQNVFSPALPAAPAASIVASSRNWFPELLFAIWVCGFAAVVFIWARQWLRIRAIAKSAKPISTRSGIAVRSTAGLMEPGAFGIVRPVLLLPEGIAGRLTTAEFSAVLDHEVCHVRRRDNLAAAIHMVVEAIFWFHPLVWWMETKLVEERERACDEEVLRLGSQPEAYAEGILKVCEFYLESPPSCVAGVTGSNLKQRIEEIMAARIAPRLGAGKKVLLAMAGIAAVAGPIVIGVVDAPRLRAQSRPASQSKGLAFEAASVKPNKSNDRLVGYQFLPGGKLSATNMPLYFLIAAAYDIPFQSGGGRLTGGPDWIRTERFDIQAVAEKSTIADDKTVKAREDKLRLMLQTLLADRFKLVIRREIKELPVYAAMVAKNGPKFEKTKVQEQDCVEAPGPTAAPEGTICHEFNGGMGRGLHGAAVDMPDLVTFVANWMDRPVVDRTGLKGLYKIETDGWRPVEPRQDDDSGKAEGGVAWSDRPTIFEIFEKLGLKLEAQKAPVEMFIIESAERPAAN